MKKMNILFLDIEGGHGGSSKSLFKTLEYIDREKINPIVICKKIGIKHKYDNLNIRCIVEKNMPTFSSLRKDNRNLLYMFYFFFFMWPRSLSFRKRLLHLIEDANINIIHFNLISLFLLARWLKIKKPRLVLTLHVRTNPVNNITSRIQAKIAANTFDGNIFITENEKANMEKLIRSKISGKIIFNSAEIIKKNNRIKRKLPLKLVVLSNYSYPRGVDRVIDIASDIPKKYRKRFKFIVAGDNKFPRFLPGKLKKFGLMGKNLNDYAKSKQVEEMFTFTGHIINTEKILKDACILIKLTRENNPWGRDIIEALARGISVISIGKYDHFVKTKYTGLLLDQYNSEEIVNWLLDHANDLKLFEKYKNNAIKIIHKFCNPKKNSLKTQIFWNEIYGKKQH